MKKKLATVMLGIVCIIALLTTPTVMAAHNIGANGDGICILAECYYAETQRPSPRCDLPPDDDPPYN